MGLATFHCLVLATTSAWASFAPTAVRLSELSADKLAAPLQEEGIVAVSDIPGYAALRKETLLALRACVATSPSSAAKSHTFGDGTVRHTLATLTDAAGLRPLKAGTSPPCVSLEAKSIAFRNLIDGVSRTFAHTFSKLVGAPPSPLLSTTDGAHSFRTISEVVEAGFQLEHFHAYFGASSTGEVDPTIGLHTDQGLFIAFTPAQLVDGAGAAASGSAGKFHLQLRSGALVDVDLDPATLIFMLGDGVDQFVNPRAHIKPLRAAPHSMVMPRTDAHDAFRLWYGRMFLPPNTALHTQASGLSYGHIRQLSKDSASGEQILSLGCSRGDDGRQLQWDQSEPQCASDEMYCWHRCMNLTEYGATADSCAAQGKRLLCVNPRDQITDGGHGDYFPKCSDSTQVETDYKDKPLPHSPRNETRCNADWEDFASTTGYMASVPLDGSCSSGGWGAPSYACTNGRLMWSVSSGILHAKVVYKGLFGWVALGLENPGGDHNGMNGAHIVLALPGPTATFTPQDGLQLGTPTVDQYVIDEDASAFRHWSTPAARRQLVAAGYETNECFTSMSFSTDEISGWKLNLSGTDSLIWGANGADSFVGYHGRPNRGKLTVDWALGTSHDEGTGHVHDDHHASKPPMPSPISPHQSPPPSAPLASASLPPPMASDSSDDSLKTNVIIGVAVAWPVSIILVAALVFVFTRKMSSVTNVHGKAIEKAVPVSVA